MGNKRVICRVAINIIILCLILVNAEILHNNTKNMNNEHNKIKLKANFCFTNEENIDKLSL